MLEPVEGVITKHICSICRKEYPTLEEARACFAQIIPARFQPGDIVIPQSYTGAPYHRYGWFNGEESWIVDTDEDPRNKMTLYRFYYVVTAVTMKNDTRTWRPHAPRYHLTTLAMRGDDGNLGHHCGKVSEYEGLCFAKCDNPPEHIVKQSRKFVGREVEHDLP